MKLIVNNPLRLEWALQTVRKSYAQYKAITVEVREAKDRSLDQNALSHVWYEQISRELQEQTAEEVKCECKLNYAIPIMREHEEWNRFCEDALDGVDYETRLERMKWVPVTSLMRKGEMARYMEQIQMAFARRGVMLQ